MKDGTRRHYEELVVRAVERVRSALDEGLELTALGRQAGLSPLHFHRIFRGLVGETPGELHRRLRLERAAWRLVTTQESVTRLALEAGYEAHESFTRAFAAAYGLAPSDFRTRARDNPTSWGAASASALAAPSGVHFVGDANQQQGAVNAGALFFKSKEAEMNVTLETMPEKRVLAAEHRGPYNMISAAFARLDTLLRSSEVGDLGGVELVAIYHDDAETVPAADLRADAGIVVPGHVTAPQGLHLLTLPGGLYARTLHQGPYERLGDAWARFMGGWLVQSGHHVGDGPMYERYLNTPGNAAPHELATELYLSLQSDTGIQSPLAAP